MMNNYSLIRKSSLLTLLFLFSFSIKAQHLLEALEGYDEYGDMVECKTISNIITAKHSTTNQTETGSFDANRWKSLPYGIYDVTEKVISYKDVLDDSNKPTCRPLAHEIESGYQPPCHTLGDWTGHYTCPPYVPPKIVYMPGTPVVNGHYWGCHYRSNHYEYHYDEIINTGVVVKYTEEEVISYKTHRCINRN